VEPAACGSRRVAARRSSPRGGVRFDSISGGLRDRSRDAPGRTGADRIEVRPLVCDSGSAAPRFMRPRPGRRPKGDDRHGGYRSCAGATLVPRHRATALSHPGGDLCGLAARIEWSTRMKYSVSIDVPRLDDGLRFYRDALGLPEIARPVATYVILKCGDAHVGLIEKSAGSRPAEGSDDVRRYERHWTP